MWGRRLCEGESSREENLRRPGKSKVIQSLTTFLLCTISSYYLNILLEYQAGWGKVRSLTDFLVCNSTMTGKSTFTRTTTIFSTTTNLRWPGKCNNTDCLLLLS